MLLDLLLSAGSREVVTLNCHQKCDQSMSLKFQDDEIMQKEFFCYYKYKNQPEDLENLSFHDFLLHYNHTIYKCWAQAKSQIIQYVSRYNFKPLSANYINYCCMKLFLHHSFQKCENVVTMTDQSEASSYVDIYNECVQLHTHSSDH